MFHLDLPIKLVHPNSKDPIYSRPDDSGMDFFVANKEYVSEDTVNYIEYDTGVAVAIPEGYTGFLFPRSSVSKTSLIMANCVGVIESTYRGTLKARFKKLDIGAEFEIGDKFVQLIVLPKIKLITRKVEDLGNTERGENGFGSSGSK